MIHSESDQPLREELPPDPAKYFGPHLIASQIQQALAACWLMLPPERRTIDEVEKQMLRMVTRAIAQFREDQRELQ
ncbi:MAG: hypothetical protein IPM13_10215 [Phycisphaerales bacterium]|nr:hypothetical protein [Phycisphaerales bacterium]